jgi:hypothetical protein
VALPALTVHWQVLNHVVVVVVGSLENHLPSLVDLKNGNSTENVRNLGSLSQCDLIGCLEKGKCVPFSKDQHERHSSGTTLEAETRNKKERVRSRLDCALFAFHGRDGRRWLLLLQAA